MARFSLYSALLRLATRRGSATAERNPVASSAVNLMNMLSWLRRSPRRLRIVTLSDRRGVESAGGRLSSPTEFEVQPLQSWRPDNDTMITTSAVGSGTTAVPGVGWATLRGVLMNDTSIVLCGDRLVSPPDTHRLVSSGMRVKGPGIVSHHARTVIVEHHRPARRAKSGIRLTGFGSSNWYHWLVEILPPAVLLDRLPPDLRDLPVIVPEVTAERAAWSESLETVLPGHPRIIAPRYGYIEVDQLHWIDPAVHGIRTFQDGATPDLDRTAVDLPVLRQFRELILDRLGVTAAPTGRRIMLTRPEGAARSANQSDLIAIARAHGLEPVDPGTLSFREQVRLFAQSDLVAGGWGAAWSSMIFAAPHSKGLMWAPAYFSRWPLYSNLAPLSGMMLRHLFVDTSSATFKSANTAPQMIRPEEFDAALRSLD